MTTPTSWSATSRGRRILPLLAAMFALVACNPPRSGDDPTPAPAPRPAEPLPTPTADLAPPIVDRLPVPRPLPGLSPLSVVLEPASGRLTGTVNFDATARSTRGIEHLRFVEPAALARADAELTLADDRLSAALAVSFPSAELRDGPVTVALLATHPSGESTRFAAEFVASNHGPAIVWRGPSDRARVEGPLVVEAEALDPNGVARFFADDERWTDLDPAPERVRFELDSTDWPDGRRHLRLVATDGDGNLNHSVRTVIVDNAPPRVLEGVAWAGGPVTGARVRVTRFGTQGFDGERIDLCPADGCITDENGAFRATLADGHTGPVRVRVLAANDGGTSSFDPVRRLPTPWPANAGLSALLPFPAAGPVQVHPVTTLIDWTVVGKARAGAPFAEIFPVARSVWSEHVCDHCDPMALGPVGPDFGLELDPAIQLAMVHSGLAVMGASRNPRGRGFEEHDPPGFWRLMVLLRRDLTDGVLDGALRDGRRVGAPVDPHTLRLHLAVAIEAALAEMPQWNGAQRGRLRGATGWLDALAGRRSALWAAEPAPIPLDRTPPVVHIARPLAESAHGPNPVELVAFGDDDGVAPRLHVAAPEGVGFIGDDLDPDAEHRGEVTGWLNVSDMPEGPLTVQVLAEDDAGHVTEESVTFVVDHTPPSLELTTLDGEAFAEDAPRFTRNDTYVFRAVSDDPEADIEVEHRSAIRPFGGAFIVSLRDFMPGAQPITVVAVDAAGNRTARTFELRWQVDGPAILPVDLQLTEPRHQIPREVDCRPVDGDPEGPEICDLTFEGRARGPYAPGAFVDRPENLSLPVVDVWPLPADRWTAPRLTLELRDPTGHDQLQSRALNSDGRWTAWAPLELHESRAVIELAAPRAGGDPEASSSEHVQVRAVDAAGNTTVRDIRWLRRMTALPLHITVEEVIAHDTPTTLGGYGFEPGRRSPEALAAPGTPETADGIRLAEWRVYNPWDHAITLRLERPSVHWQHARSRAYRTQAVLPDRLWHCRPGQFFVGGPDGRPTSGCADSPWALVGSGERIMADFMGRNRAVHRAADGRLLEVPPEGVVVPPRRHLDLTWLADLPNARLLPGLQAEVDEGSYLYQVMQGIDARVRFVQLERDVRLSWRAYGTFMTRRPGADDVVELEGREFYAGPIDIVRAPMRLPAGLEER